MAEEARAKAERTKDLLHRGGDPLEALRHFFGIGVLAKRVVQALPQSQVQMATRQPTKIPLLMRSHINRAMFCWVDGEGEHVRACVDDQNCVFRMLCRTLEHPELYTNRRNPMPGRALYTPDEIAAKCTEPRQCIYCSIFTTNVLVNYFRQEGGCGVVLNAFRVATSVPGEFPPGSVMESADGLSGGLFGAFPFFNPQQLVPVMATGPTKAFGFTLGVPVF